MSTVILKTENAVFEFSRKDMVEHLIIVAAENSTDEAIRLLKLISIASDETILIPKEHDHFGYVALDLIDAGKGSISCKICDKIYKASQLESLVVGHGRNPFDLNTKTRGGVKNLFKGKMKMPAMFGGKGYRCPEGHDLISMITWQT